MQSCNLAFPIIGIINGLFVPIIMLPTLLCDMSEERELIYRMILHTILYFGVFIFWIKGKNWRDNFADESQDRHLHKWEFALLGIVSILMTIFSFGIAAIPVDTGNNPEFVNYIRNTMFFMDILSFILTIIVIILIVQGNKRSFYHRKALINQEIADLTK